MYSGHFTKHLFSSVLTLAAFLSPAAILQADDYYQWPQYSPTVSYDYQDEFGTLEPPTMVLDDVTGVAGTYADGWWCFRWGDDKNPAVTEDGWIPLIKRLNDDFSYITDIMRWPRDYRARNGYYSTVYLYGSGLSTDSASNTDKGGWQGTTWYNNQAWPMILASYFPVACFDPTYTGSDAGYQQGAMVHEGIHSILSSMPGCKNACWFQEGGNTWLQGTMEAQRSGNFDGMGWLSVGAAIAPFMPIECYTGWLQDGSFGGPCAEGVNMFEGSQQICTWRNLLGGSQYGEAFPHAMEVILGPQSIAWLWRYCDRSGRLLQDLAEAPNGIGSQQTRRLIQEYRARQAFCDFGLWSYAYRQLLNGGWNAEIKAEWAPYWIDCPVWNATCYAKTTQTGNILEPEDRTLPGWSGANQIPLTIDQTATEAAITFNPIGSNMSCQLTYRDTSGNVHYSSPVSSGSCSIPLANVLNNVIVAVICNTDYIYNGEATRTAKFDYSINIDSGIDGKADIYTRWFEYNPTNYTITASAQANGYIIPDGAVTANPGSSTTFTFLPENGYEVDQVILNGFPIGSMDSYTFNSIHGSYSISATFKSLVPANISFQSETPAITDSDIYQLNTSDSYADNIGYGNNSATYIGQNRTSLGQSFTTGPDLNGYHVSGLWLKHVSYAQPNASGTNWDINNQGARLQLRLSQANGTTLSNLLIKDYTISGIETGTDLMSDDAAADKTGTGTWIYFELDNNLLLAPNTTYALDLTVLDDYSDFFFESAGTSTDSYTAGSAYTTYTKDDTDMGTVYSGDHTFIINLQTISAIDNCTAHYDMENNTTDSSGSGNNAAAYGSPDYSAGYTNTKALLADGFDDYISIPKAAINHTDITVAAWVYWTGSSQWQRIFDFGDNTTKYMFLTPRSANNTLKFAITTASGGGEQILETSQLTANQWTHIAVTLLDDTATLFINGSAVATNNTITLNPTDVGLTYNYIAKSQWPDPFFSGMIDDFRIYDHALSKTEVAAITSFAKNQNSPYFTTNPIIAPDACEDSPYTSSIASFVTDPQGSDLTFTKLSGPQWLSLASDGTISGTPKDSNPGINSFYINAQNTNGLSRTAQLQINVDNIYSGSRGVDDLAGFLQNWLDSQPDLYSQLPMLDFAQLAHNWLNDSSLQLYLNFDNDISDSSNYNRPCTTYGTPLRTMDYYKRSLLFDGTNDYLLINDYFAPAKATPRTVAAWIKVNQDLANNDHSLLVIASWGKNDSQQTGQKWFIAIDDATGQLAVGIFGARIKGGPDLEDNTWHHIAITLPEQANNLTKLKLYVDGCEVATNADSIDHIINTSQTEELLIGAMDITPDPGIQTPARFFKGHLDDLKIYNRPLTPTQIISLTH